LVNCLALFALMARMTSVEPSLITRARIREISINDHSKASSPSFSLRACFRAAT